jgi:hypothetical protein
LKIHQICINSVYKGYYSNVRINKDNQVEIEYENYDPTERDASGNPIPPTYWTGVPMVLEGSIYRVSIPGIGDHTGEPFLDYEIILVENSTPILNVTRSVRYPSGESEKETSTWKFIDEGAQE